MVAKKPKYNEMCAIHMVPLERKKAEDGGTEVWCTHKDHGLYMKIKQRFGT